MCPGLESNGYQQSGEMATKSDRNAIMPPFAVFPSRLVLGFFHSSLLRWGIFTRNVQNP